MGNPSWMRPTALASMVAYPVAGLLVVSAGRSAVGGWFATAAIGLVAAIGFDATHLRRWLRGMPGVRLRTALIPLLPRTFGLTGFGFIAARTSGWWVLVAYIWTYLPVVAAMILAGAPARTPPDRPGHLVEASGVAIPNRPDLAPGGAEGKRIVSLRTIDPSGIDGKSVRVLGTFQEAFGFDSVAMAVAHGQVAAARYVARVALQADELEDPSLLRALLAGTVLYVEIADERDVWDLVHESELRDASSR